MKFAQVALVTLSLVASSAFAQETTPPEIKAPAPVPAPAPVVPAPAAPTQDVQLQPLTPEMVAASQKELYAKLREQIAAGRASGAISPEQYARLSKSWAQLSDELLVAADDAARVSSYLGDGKFVFGIMVTYGTEYIFGANGKALALGPSAEVGVAGFVSNNFEFVFTGVVLGGFAFEQSFDVNVTQNRSQPDRGWRIKLLLASKRVANISNFSGAFVGGGIDATNIASAKGYVGGCFNSDEFVRADMKDMYSSEQLYNKAWQVPYNYIREHLANCNAYIISIARGQNEKTPPWSWVEKGLYLTFPASNRGFGYKSGDVWRGLRTGIWE